MDSRQKKMVEALAALSASERKRLERLAAMANMPPEAIWPDVWRYGFEDTEESIKADLEADADIAAGRLIPHEEVMAEARRIIESHAQRKRKAG